jgi:3-polyprenyl-4-hydroxybenzoate decarboxylase
MIIAVNEDIHPENLDMLFWAMSYRMRPHQDLRILDHRDMGHGPRTGADDNHYEATDSAMLINAMIKRPFPPISLPARQFMENAKLIWAAPKAGNALVRLFTRSVARGIRGRSRAGDAERILDGG